MMGRKNPIYLSLKISVLGFSMPKEMDYEIIIVYNLSIDLQITQICESDLKHTFPVTSVFFVLKA